MPDYIKQHLHSLTIMFYIFYEQRQQPKWFFWSLNITSSQKKYSFKNFFFFTINVNKEEVANLVTLGQRDTDYINWMITLTKPALWMVDCNNAELAWDNFN